MSVWWPVEATSDGKPGFEIEIEPRIGGRIYERTAAGVETEWGEITTWEPPRRLGYLWHIMTERSNATDIEIRFSELSPSSTRVEIVHTGWDRLGDFGPPWRARNRAGWDGVIPAFFAACTLTG